MLSMKVFLRLFLMVAFICSSNVFVSSASTKAPFGDDATILSTNSQADTQETVIMKQIPKIPEPAGVRLRIASYNIAHGRGYKTGGLNEIAKLKNLRAIADLLRDQKADLIGFTEISSHDARAKFIDQPKYIANRLGFYHVYAENTQLCWGFLASQGNAVVSRFPIIWWQNHKLYRASPDNEQRGCLETLIDLGNNRKLRFLVCHLSTNSEESQHQVEEILEIVKASKEPVILCGDFNLRPTSPAIKSITKLMRDASANLTGTYIGNPNNPKIKIDYIFTRGPISFGVCAAVGGKEKLSDHLCLINTFWVGDNTK